mmetsp:Transcript_7591/g.13702  ORF Transcript_7591/g.13702 Transcript_7591/m.13702 type:complete len:351 (+) Transcript_7591:326-1378(+)
MAAATSSRTDHSKSSASSSNKASALIGDTYPRAAAAGGTFSRTSPCVSAANASRICVTGSVATATMAGRALAASALMGCRRSCDSAVRIAVPRVGARGPKTFTAGATLLSTALFAISFSRRTKACSGWQWPTRCKASTTSHCTSEFSSEDKDSSKGKARSGDEPPSCPRARAAVCLGSQGPFCGVATSSWMRVNARFIHFVFLCPNSLRAVATPRRTSSLSCDSLPRTPKAFFGDSAAKRHTASKACFETSTSSDFAKASNMLAACSGAEPATFMKAEKLTLRTMTSSSFISSSKTSRIPLGASRPSVSIASATCPRTLGSSSSEMSERAMTTSSGMNAAALQMRPNALA